MEDTRSFLMKYSMSEALKKFFHLLGLPLIVPFSFSESHEYCKMQGKEISPDELFIDYINWGGLPLRFSFEREGDVKKYVEQTYQGILDKDIITDRSKINRQKFERIAGYIMANAGKEFSAKNIETYFENQNYEQIDKKTVYRYLDKMEKACLIDRVKRYNIVGKQAMAYVEKTLYTMNWCQETTRFL